MLVVRLRRKIEADPKRPILIVTIPGSGYKFAAKVTIEAASALVAAEPVVTSDKGAPAARERRYVTALAAQLVAEAGTLPGDPEELRVIIEEFRRYASAIITRYCGVVAQCHVRDVLAYFGYPVAQEHAAERAIHAGLARAAHLDAGEAPLSGFSIRVGIASGLVVTAPAGEVLGETPGEAARLHDLAGPGQVIIAANTQRLVGGLFACRGLGATEPDGAARAWHVLGPAPLASRSEALHGEALSPLIGREDELSLLLRAWRQAKSGAGRLVLLCGEPGIGKSRLLAALEQELITEPHTSLRYFCSPLHRDSALHPVIARWEQEAGFTRTDPAEDRLRKLEAILATADLPSDDLVLFAALLSVPTGERYQELDLSPQRRKERTFAALLRRLKGLARTQPVLMLFEDAHWADPSSVELLDTLIDELADLPILLAISFRPEFTAPWVGRAGTSLITLSRLDRRQSASLAMQVISEHVLTNALLDRIVARTDGVPLFIEELAKAIIATGFGGDLSLDVPDTLQASLMARIDQLPAAKQVAQIGAAIGREFPHALLAAVAGLPEAQLTEGLNELVVSGLASCRGLQPDAVYTFKHALVQDAAYSTLLRDERQQLHARVADALVSEGDANTVADPEIVAHHLQMGGRSKEAIAYWREAGERAVARSANLEAIAFLRRGSRFCESSPIAPSVTERS